MTCARALLALLALSAIGCGRDLANGLWLLWQDGPPEQDTCDRLAEDGSLPDIYLIHTGEEVHLEFGWLGADRRTSMIGRFKHEVFGEPDGFTADGSFAGEEATIWGTRCVLSFAQLHLDAVLDEGGRSFRGGLTVQEILRPNQDPRCPQRCDLVVPYAAVLSPD